MIIDSAFAGSLADVFGRMPASIILAPFLLPHDLMSKKKKQDNLTREKVLRRFANTEANKRADFFAHLLKDENAVKDPKFFFINAATLLTAGSETTATFLAATTYFLLSNSNTLQILQKEVRERFAKSEDIDQDSTSNLQYLLGIIEESLRLFPPIGFGLQRISPGAEVDGVYVPKGVSLYMLFQTLLTLSQTTLSTAIYTASHSERYFHDAQNFHPERWLPPSHPHYNIAFVNDQKEASKPFSTGPRGCLGINLAYLEMRITLCKLIWHYDWELKSNDVDWVRDTGMTLLWRKPTLMVRFIPVKPRV